MKSIIEHCCTPVLAAVAPVISVNIEPAVVPPNIVPLIIQVPVNTVPGGFNSQKAIQVTVYLSPPTEPSGNVRTVVLVVPAWPGSANASIL